MSAEAPAQQQQPQQQPQQQSYLLAIVVVGGVWGLTNPLVKRGAEHAQRRRQQRSAGAQQPGGLLGVLGEWAWLATTPSFILPQVVAAASHGSDPGTCRVPCTPLIHASCTPAQWGGARCRSRTARPGHLTVRGGQR